MVLLRHRVTAGRDGSPLPQPPGRPEEEELKRIALRRAEADGLRLQKDHLISEFFKLGVAISNRGWFGDSKRRLTKLDKELAELDRRIEEIGQ